MENKKILIVDDEIASELKDMLKGVPANIYLARNLEEAVAAINRHNPDLVSLDNYIPNDENDRDVKPYGGDLAKACKQRSPDTRVVGVSSLPQTFNNKGYFDAVLHKRRDMGRYKSTVEGLLENAANQPS